MQKNKPPGAPEAQTPWIDPDDAPKLTKAFFEDAETYKGDVFVKRGRGRPPTGAARELVSFRIDQDIMAKLRAAGPGWQSQVNGLLRAALAMAAGAGKDEAA